MSHVEPTGPRPIWAYLLHLGFNLWCDADWPANPVRSARPFLRCDRALWRELVARMAAAGVNMAVIDLAEGVRYRSHPELGVRGSWTPAQLRRELAWMRAQGVEPIPKLNFSATHDAWLGEYARCVSTPRYYQVCRDLIDEVAALFDRPRFFHLGMDEESPRFVAGQKACHYIVIRQHDLWWHDLKFLAAAAARHGARPWVWSDYYWDQPADFLANMPRSIVQSNWYYRKPSGKLPPRGATWGRNWVETFRDLSAQGYDQVPAASTCVYPENFRDIVRHCRRRIDPGRLPGFMQTTWRPTLKEYRAEHLAALEQMGRVIKAAQGGRRA